MKLLTLIFCLTFIFVPVGFTQVFGDSIASELSKRDPNSKEKKKKMLQMMNSFREYSSGARSATKDDIQLVEELYSMKGESKLSVDIKSYAFATMPHVKDVSEWSLELPILLMGDSKQMAEAALGAIYYTYKKGSDKDKLFLLNSTSLEETLKKVSENVNDENYTSKINEIFELADELQYLKKEKNPQPLERNERKQVPDKKEVNHAPPVRDANKQILDNKPMLGDSSLTSQNKTESNSEKKIEPVVEKSWILWIVAGLLVLGLFGFWKTKK